MPVLTANIDPTMQLPDLVERDRCDADNAARAVVRVVLRSGKLLDFCMHHYKKHEFALMAAGARVHQVSVQEGN